MMKKRCKSLVMTILTMICSAPVFAGEASLVVPNIKVENLQTYNFLVRGFVVAVRGVVWGIWAYT